MSRFIASGGALPLDNSGVVLESLSAENPN